MGGGGARSTGYVRAPPPSSWKGHDLKFSCFDAERNLSPLACLDEYQMTRRTRTTNGGGGGEGAGQ